MKAAALILYVGGIVLILNQCTPTAPDRTVAEKASLTKPTAAAPKPDESSLMSEQARARAEKKKQHDRHLAERLAVHQRLEADLKTLAQTEIPVAIGELASEATRYRNKRSDLKHLDKRAQWDRETPVKNALARARELIGEYYATDREAQKGRDGPTTYVDADSQALAKRLQEFKKDAEAFGSFAADLPAFVGKVPEKLALSALDSIAQMVLPADAYDPCRDPAACPKAVVPDEPAAALSTADRVLRLCVSATANPGDLAVYDQPDTTARIIARLRPGQCDVAATGHKDAYNTPWGRSAWQRISLDGKTGWVREGVLSSKAVAGTPSMIGSDTANGLERAASSGSRYCVSTERVNGSPLALRTRPDPAAPRIAHIAPTSCLLTATGREAHYADRTGRTLWLEIRHDHGPSGWVNANFLRRAR
jgi:SH3-like domain-containing protein